MSLLQALLGFVALNPTYTMPVLLRIAKPNNGRFRNRPSKVSISIKLAAVLASGAARVKLQRNGLNFIFLDRIYKIDGIFFAFGEEPFRPKAVLSR
ncbi:MAG: hypothetical protein WCB15_03975 [Desulfobacterales bacterium]